MDTNVRTTVIFQGSTATNIAENSGLINPGGEEAAAESPIKTMTPEEAAVQIADALEKNKYQAAVGSDAAMMNFLARLSPERAAKIIFNNMRSLLPD